MLSIQQIEPYFGEEEAEAVKSYILSGGWGTDHIWTRRFEDELAKFLGVKYCSVTTSGTQALIFALMACGIKQGDEVICPSLTMIATPNAVRAVGAKPVFVDVNNRGVLDLQSVLEAITPNTRAILYVSLNGRASDLHPLIDYFLERNVYLIEDACQSFGSKHNGQYLGTIGHIGCFSLSPHKIISTGQGGFAVTDDEKLITKFRQLRDFGRLKGGSDIHSVFGLNGKFTDFQSIIGLEQLKRLPDRISKKIENYKLYEQKLSKFVNFIKHESVPWFVDIYVENPDSLHKYLTAEGIGSRRMYPPCHKQGCYSEDLALPITSLLSNMGLWLPSSPNLTEEQVEEVCQKILKFMGK